MTIQLTCQGCSETLAVPDEHAGKKARCPRCQEVNQIPSNSATQPTKVSSIDEVRPQKATDNPFESKVSPKPTTASPYATPMAAAAYGMQSRYQTPHRGGLVLTLGILSLFCNFFLVPGILAWTFGSSDLKKMRAGEMDSTGYGTTQAGMIIGIIATCLFFLAIIFYIIMLFLVFGIAAAGAA